MKRILLVESDEEQSQKLSAAIEAWGEYTVSPTATVREAFLLIAQQPFDLALIPGTDVGAARKSLQSLLPELDLAVIMPGEPVMLEEQEFSDLRGVIFTEAPESGLREIFGDKESVGVAAGALNISSEPAVEGTRVSAPGAALAETIVTRPPPVPEPDESTGNLHRVLQSFVDQGEIVGGLLTASSDIVASAGLLTGEQVAAIARRVSMTWHEESTALLQFMRPPDRASDLLLFTRPVQLQQLLTLAAGSDFNVGRMRRAADELARELASLSDTGSEGADARAGVAEPANARVSEQLSFALLLRPRRPLPAALQAAVAMALYDVAEEAGCNVHFQQVDAELVHLVTTCPSERGSGWLARLYKRGVEERIQDRFGVPAHLWRKGFYATESELPLSDAELTLFAGDELE